jgi:threonine dehydratase
LEVLLRRILTAKVYDVAQETPLQAAPRLSERLGHRVYLKREDLQPVFSFKLRGAYNKLANLSAAERARGVIAASAGNHAQGVALAAAHLGARATIVMPTTTPTIKVGAVEALGATVVLMGDTFDQARTHALERAAEHGEVFVHPYDDLDVIAGQGTIAMELVRQQPGGLDVVFVPVGGGGLLAGIAGYLSYVRPETRIVAVEPEDAACFEAAMAAGRPVTLPTVGLFVDGCAVARIGDLPFAITKDSVHEVITAGTDEVCAAIKDVFDDTRSIAEPAGALAVAGMKRWAAAHPELQDQILVAIDSGANMNFDRLRHVSERAEIGEDREAVYAVAIPERAGAFRTFCETLGPRNITEFNYRFADPAQAHVFVGVALRHGRPEREAIATALCQAGYTVNDLTDNEVAKLHVRHMVGGKAPAVSDEVVCRFEFPERPGALLKFLTRLSGRWNISTFHYRNHGAAYGRVLAGLQVPAAERGAFFEALTDIGYPFSDETENPAFRIFL